MSTSEPPRFSPPPPYSPPPRPGLPVWAWALIGCGGLLLIVPVVLAAILFPVFAQARQTAQSTLCLSNMKQQGIGLRMYSLDYDQLLPPAKRWMDAEYPYTKNNTVFQCPTLRRSDPSAFGYAFDSRQSGKNIEKMRDPASVVVNYDSSNRARNATDAGTSLPAPARHPRGNNIGYADGHVQSKR